MKHFLIYLLQFIITGAPTFSQNTIDLAEIKKVTLDTSTGLFYNSLVEEFNLNPSGLDISRGTVIYYGKLYSNNYKPFKINFDEIDFTNLISKKKFKQAILKGEEIIKSDPVNIEILWGLLICYKKGGFTDKADLTKAKLDLLVASVLDHGSGQTNGNTLKVISVGDEYAMMRILGITGISRQSKMSSSSTLDIWKAKSPKGKRIDYFVEVLFN